MIISTTEDDNRLRRALAKLKAQQQQKDPTIAEFKKALGLE